MVGPLTFTLREATRPAGLCMSRPGGGGRTVGERQWVGLSGLRTQHPPPHPTLLLQGGEEETFTHPKRWLGGKGRWMVTALRETTTARPGVLSI